MTVELEERLNAFETEVRRASLKELLASEPLRASRTDNVNLHLHSFFSYNAKGWSPSRIAWEAYKRGYYAVGLCDFDVLDGQEEFLSACELLGMRSIVNLETRTFVQEKADKEIDSPGEPGVSYAMGCGFARHVSKGMNQAKMLSRLRLTARERNVALIGRINAQLDAIAINYEQDVLPMTPKGAATERHIVKAYIEKSSVIYGEGEALAAFWAPVLGLTVKKAQSLLEDRTAMENSVRSCLAKRGGVGYKQPSDETFPSLIDFFSWVRSCGAIPMESWLDGTSEGEKDPRAMLEYAQANGAEALNIIPDRNWNISDSQKKALKLGNLKAIVEAADAMDIPLHIGTEMNKLGQPDVDDLNGECLRPFKQSFIHGAQVLCGHSILLRYAGYSYVGPQAKAEFGSDIKRKNQFFATVGAMPPVTPDVAQRLNDVDDANAFTMICNALMKKAWQ